MTNHPVIQRARETKFYQEGLRELGRQLPAQDDELDRILADAAAAQDDLAFPKLILAAVAAGRKVNARHLVEGAILFSGPAPFASAALHCEGNVARALLDALARGGFASHSETGVLAVAAAWCEDHPEEPFPSELISRARMRARELLPHHMPAIELLSVAKRSQDPGLRSILEKAGHGEFQPMSDEILDPIFAASRASPLAHVPEQPGAVAISGYTVRRAVPRIGRNDSCPCGSGKKYKKCCYDKDQERLRHPSAVPGLTLEEWRAAPELALSKDRLARMRAFELTRLDPLKIPEDLRWQFLDLLAFLEQLEPAVAAFEKLGYQPNYELPWHYSLRLATQAGRRDLVERLLRVRTDEHKDDDISLSTRLLIATKEGDPLLNMVETEARAALKADSTAPLVELAYSMLDSQAPSLGILLARSVLPLVSVLEAITVYEQMLKTRDRLQLPPDDPFDPILDARLLDPPDNDEAAASSRELREARAGLEAKNEEVRKLAEEMARLNRELEQRDKSKPRQAETKPFPVTPSLPQSDLPPALDERAITQMRQRMSSLREMLKERHAERNQLRRELQAAHAQIQALHNEHPATPTPAASSAPPDEEDLLLADEEFSSQPVRIPEFPRKFQSTLTGFPKPVARACLALIGRMAGGDPAAFAGSKRLKTAPDFHRQRLAGDYRLLFRLHSDRLEVVELIHRRDLERKIKALP